MKRCLERFEVHSWYRWTWNGKVYARECSLRGCDAAQEVDQVRAIHRTPMGKIEEEEPVTIPGTIAPDHAHHWSPWGLIEEFHVKDNLYHVRNCAGCAAKQYTHDLVATTQPRILEGQDDGNW